jgi:hypothetical protein
MSEIGESHRITFLDELTVADRPAAGAKAVALGVLGRTGFRVPAGFVVPAGGASDAAVADAYGQLEARTGRGAVAVAVRASVLGDERTIGPPPAAETDVRGSAAVIDAVGRSRAALARAGRGGAAVIVQEMAIGGRAGIAYTVDPVRRDDGIVRVTAGFGADTTWSSAHEVDTYLVSRRTGEMMEAVVVPKGGPLGRYRRVLTDDEAAHVAGTAMGVERCLGPAEAVDYLLDPAGRVVLLKASALERNGSGATATA